MTIQIKALNDWQLEVLGVPFGDPDNLDLDGEYFDAETNFYEVEYPSPPVAYYHGLNPDGTPAGEPQFIGKTISREVRSDGVWFRVILDKANKLAQRVWQAAKDGIARASSGAGHLARIDEGGHILHWPIVELSIFDVFGKRQPANMAAVALPAKYKKPDMSKPEAKAEQGNLAEAVSNSWEQDLQNLDTGDNKMDEKEIQAQLEAAKAAGRAEAEAEVEAQKARELELETAKEEAVKAFKEQQEKDAKEKEEKEAKSRRLPDGKAPYVAKAPELWKYDNLSPEDQAVLVGVLNAGDGQGRNFERATPAAVKALAVKMVEAQKSNSDARAKVGRETVSAMKAAGIKTDEVMHSDLTSHGDEWIGVGYSRTLWEKIRTGTFVAEKIPTIEVPQGIESMVIPLESTDPTYYKVAEVEDLDATSGWPVATIPDSQSTTANKTLSVGKMGARVLWSGEMAEDSLIPFVSQLRMQLEKAGAEQLEHAIIDGDNATTASTNINDIGGTPSASTLHMIWDGIRYNALIANSAANARDGGALTVDDFLDTVKLMGTAGQNSLDHDKVGFIPDANVYWKALELAEVLTDDVRRSGATLTDGQLKRIWGYEVNPSWQMHRLSSNRKVDSAGKIDQDTTTNNTKGALLAVRWDQWLLGYWRHMTMETTRIARADATEIVALMRVGLLCRDYQASAITYNLTV